MNSLGLGYFVELKIKYELLNHINIGVILEDYVTTIAIFTSI